ncbi:MAG TPA: alkyl hydroperoxide reductase subunit F [Accumulibacter sp.]|nr:alkyl hydroperoxide reductase subunit F [Accumulibacter sp.]HMW17180.1 alkyl hydroperoxide reductase subunit F [Accumulibacter sp.]HMX22012.1 alkyl hydroperoxide reductase subunit F [Accumulibacter sp.]HMY05954.1 alkyl hydroperoxide reductase subunit F [Accumulibacter sp.]HNC18274.1 alkyl hydroperoxide reductase subunit F [Accumulibacter sp.]
MLDANVQARVRAYLEKIQQPIELIASLDDSDHATQISDLLDDLADLSDKISVRHDGQAERRPSFAIARTAEEPRISFAGLPMGHEFTSLILALLQTGGHPPKVESGVIEAIRGISGRFHFETFISLSCHNCPEVVQALNLMAMLNPGISHQMIDGALFPEEIDSRQIMGVPTVYLNGEHFGQGRMTVEEIVSRLDSRAAEREAEKISARQPYDVLIVGGGPAGAAAAIYAARKGIRTGIVGERFGGQVLDTLAIENFISVKATDGPKLVASLEEHVREYGVDIINLQRATSLKTGADGGLSEVGLASGATLRSKAVIIATGARWREMNVPGEKEYRNHGVAYCPHCDGPLFKGKHVAVIGGGNSGVEAAIDLAGIVGHVTLLEFDPKLRADAILQNKLFSLPNITVITSALTTEVVGDGQKVGGLIYTDRTNGSSHHLELEGIFVQIGLLPNSEWLKDTLALSSRGEIEINSRNETSLAGVFAAGDVSTVPYKQIVIAIGEGAKASLSAFDYLIRQ